MSRGRVEVGFGYMAEFGLGYLVVQREESRGWVRVFDWVVVCRVRRGGTKVG